MSEKAKSVMGGAVPRWATAIAMAVSAFFLHRLVNQLDVLSGLVAQQQTAIAVRRSELKYSTDVLSKLSNIGDLLDRRISNLERRNPSAP
jgi:hypothetical protein